MVKLVILRGLPDSNKDEIVKTQYSDFVHLEATMFFLLNGKYFYKKEDNTKAHKWCQEQVNNNLAHGKNVVVTNTFVRRWEIDPYILMSRALGTDLEIVTATGKGINKTNVPQEVIDNMKIRWEDINLVEAIKYLANKHLAI